MRAETRFQERWLGAAVLLATAIAISAYLIHETSSLDVWWQVAIGRDILTNLSIPTTDVYAAAANGYAYHDAHWLFQVLVAFFDRFFGMAGVQLATVLFWVPTLYCCYRATRRWSSVLLASSLLYLAAMASVERFLPRPEIATFFGLAAFYYLLQESRFRSYRQLLLFFAIEALWVNAHGLFVLGPFLVGCYWLAAAFRRWRGVASEHFASLTRLLVVVLAATLVTPHGIWAWSYPVLLVTQVGPWAPAVFDSLQELSPTFGTAARSGLAFWFYIILLVVTLASIAAAAWKREVSWPRLLIISTMLLLSLSGRRNVVLFALVAAPFTAEGLSYALDRGAQRFRALALVPLSAMVLSTSFVLSGAYYVFMEIPARAGFGVTPSFFPHGLPAFLDHIDFDGQVLNSNTIGGFYLYHGFPNRLPLTDGRWVSYEPELLEWTLSTSRNPRRWREVVERFDIEGILLAHSSPEAKAILPDLSRDPGWRLVYLDAAASFWLPVDRAANVPPIDLHAVSSLPVLRRIDDGLILDEFLARMGTPILRTENLERTLAFGSRRELLLERLGMSQIQAGMMSDAEESLRELVSAHPDHVPALNELAFLAYRRGDLRKAEQWMRRALDVEPDNRELQENFQRIRQQLEREMR